MDSKFVESSLNESYEEWVKLLTEEEKDAVFVYTTNQYKEINGYLRNEQDFFDSEEQIKKNITLIDSALSKFILRESTVVFRFEDRELKLKDKLLNFLKTRKQIWYSNFCSTTIEESHVDKLIKYSQKIGREIVVLKIKALVPKGFKCAYIPNLSDYPDEKELLIARNVYLNIYKVEEKNNIIYLYGKMQKGED